LLASNIRREVINELDFFFILKDLWR
jgi:hypothetical protein